MVSERRSHTKSYFFETNLNKIKHHFSGNKGTWAMRRINELTILTANYNFTENLASQRPKLSLFSSLLLTPRPQKNRRGKTQRFLGKAMLRMYFIFLSTQSLLSLRIADAFPEATTGNASALRRLVLVLSNFLALAARACGRQNRKRNNI